MEMTKQSLFYQLKIAEKNVLAFLYLLSTYFYIFFAKKLKFKRPIFFLIEFFRNVFWVFKTKQGKVLLSNRNESED